MTPNIRSYICTTSEILTFSKYSNALRASFETYQVVLFHFSKGLREVERREKFT